MGPFSKCSARLSHQNIHIGEQPCQCTECGKAARSRSSVSTRARALGRPCEGSECTRAFRWASPLPLHQRTHTGENAYKCPNYRKPFPYGSSLTEHQKTHPGEKRCKCRDGETSSATAPLGLGRIPVQVRRGGPPSGTALCCPGTRGPTASRHL